jgi:hypothetical protein
MPLAIRIGDCSLDDVGRNGAKVFSKLGMCSLVGFVALRFTVRVEGIVSTGDCLICVQAIYVV